jgi:uncharacterized LabA/DUF88 family protein
MREPQKKRVAAFVDGQNLYYAAKYAFGYGVPNYDPLLLANEVCNQFEDWVLVETCFYTGVPSPRRSPELNAFWVKKLQVMSTRGVRTYSGRVTPRGAEKGVDIRIALDVISTARAGLADVILIFSQDQDLAEVAAEIRVIAREDDRWIKVASAYPVGPGTANKRGIDRTDWLRIDRATYDRCIDPLDYWRPLEGQGSAE